MLAAFHSAFFDGDAAPAIAGSTQLVGGPVFLVQFQRDDLDRVIPQHRFEPDRITRSLVPDGRDEVIDSAHRLIVNGKNSPPRPQTEPGRRRTIIEKGNVDAFRWNAALCRQCAMRLLQ